MDYFYLNPFIFIAKEGERYFISVTGGQVLSLSDEQADLLLENKEFTREQLTANFSPPELKILFRCKCFIPFQFDLTSRNSRTNGYFYELGWLEEYQKLKEKHVYLLGAGALGTHIGWGLCSLGVKNFTILDYDKIEDSNLNRQVLYSIEDVGRKKTEVLKERLLSINPECSIKIVNKKVDGMECLRELLKGHPDLVVRGIDTPVEISHWVFQVCEEMGIAYISGGTLGTKSLYGPTYVPEVTPKHDSIKINGKKMYRDSDSTVRIRGTGVSTGFAITSVASEIIIDAVKILIEKNELIKYGGKVEIVDHFQEQKELSIKENNCLNKNYKFINAVMGVTAIIIMIAALFAGNTPIIPICYFLLASLVFGIWHMSEKQMYINAMVVGAVAGCGNFLVSIGLRRFPLFQGADLLTKLSSIPTIIFLLTVMICLHSMMFILIAGVENKLIKKIK